MDIKIIGAGPGGLITGLKLLEAGFKPTIVEKQKEIHSTLCGEGISSDSLAKIPFRDWSSFAPSTFEHATFFLPSGYKIYAKKKCYTMDRTPWLRAMVKEFEERGGNLELGRKINSVKDLDYDLLIGADGPFSITAKHVGNKMKFIAGVQYRIKADYPYDGMEFHLNKKYSQEYAWVFAKGDILNVGTLGTLKQLDMFVQDRGLADGEVIDRVGYNIPFFGTKIQEGNVILTGDAAGITNPLTKGGMAAIVNVADILVGCLKEGKIEQYQKRVFSHPVMAPEYKTALQHFTDLDNEKLIRIGRMLNGKDLRNLDKATKLKVIFAAVLKPRKMRTLMKASSYANKYSW